MLLAIGIAALIIFALLIFAACYEPACDAFYTYPSALARAQAAVLKVEVKRIDRLAHKTARTRFYRTCMAVMVEHKLVVRALANVHSFMRMSGLFPTRNMNRVHVSKANLGAPYTCVEKVYTAEPRLEAIARARSCARAIGIRTRATNQAMRKAYMKLANRAGLDYAAGLELDRMLMS